jgi:small nuclear ribonucleoprotein (snRNP)-like protein
VEFLQERKKEQFSLAEETSVQPTVVERTQSEQSVIYEVVKKLNSLESFLREVLLLQSGRETVFRGKGFSLEMLIGKPVTVRTVDNKLFSGELLGYDEDMIYVLSVENKTEEKRFHSGGKRTPYVKRVSQEPQSFVYSISRQIVELLETPASFFDFDSEPKC